MLLKDSRNIPYASNCYTSVIWDMQVWIHVDHVCILAESGQYIHTFYPSTIPPRQHLRDTSVLSISHFLNASSHNPKETLLGFRLLNFQEGPF